MPIKELSFLGLQELIRKDLHLLQKYPDTPDNMLFAMTNEYCQYRSQIGYVVVPFMDLVAAISAEEQVTISEELAAQLEERLTQTEQEETIRTEVSRDFPERLREFSAAKLTEYRNKFPSEEEIQLIIDKEVGDWGTLGSVEDKILKVEGPTPKQKLRYETQRFFVDQHQQYLLEYQKLMPNLEENELSVFLDRLLRIVAMDLTE